MNFNKNVSRAILASALTAGVLVACNKSANQNPQTTATRPSLGARTMAVSLSQGFEVGLHINTGCADFTPASLDTTYTQQVSGFTSSYPGIPAPITQRHHCIVWSDCLFGNGGLVGGIDFIRIQ